MVLTAATAAGELRGEGGADYLQKVKPLLQARCYACHGALKQKAGLRLDTAALLLKGGESGAAVKPGDAAGSLLIEKVMAPDIDERMPPEHEGEPFKLEEVQILRDWIAAGAVAPAEEKPEADPREHWAFRPVVRPAVPVIEGPWGQHPIDAFLAKQHREHGLTPQPEASREVLLRRLYLDLIGLPPGAEEIAAAERDAPETWYATAVERLLASPAHGERWARHWMDIWRYSDWWGLGEQLRNSQKHMWHWRDWIVESLNGDTSYAEMIRLMLAADELHPGDLQKLRATGFLARNYFLFNRHQWMEETVEHVSKGLLGLTMNCAKCHDHKYDPLTQKDFYRMRAFFEPYHVRMDVVPDEPDLERDGIPRVYDGWPDEPTWRFIRGEESKPDKSAPMVPGVPAILGFRELNVSPVSLPDAAWQPERQPWVIESYVDAARRKLAAAEGELQRLNPEESGELAEATLRVAALTVDAAKAGLHSAGCRGAAMRATWGQPDAGGEAKMAAVLAEREAAAANARLAVAEKERLLLQAAPDKKPETEKALQAARDACVAAEKAVAEPLKPDAAYTRIAGAKWTATRFRNSTADDPDVPFLPQSTGRRRALAEWITDLRHPLTARVAVNHIWTRHMGTPLVATVFDFGRKGTAPAHPEMLDWLAAEFMEHGWSMKHLHRLIVTSSAYRMSSSLAGAQASAAKDPDKIYLWRRPPVRLDAELVRDAILAHTGERDAVIGGPPVPPAAQEESKRRSLYFFHSNNERNLFLTTFDGAAVKECYRREQSIVPQQALALSNSRLVHTAARKIAERLSQMVPGSAAALDDGGFIRRAWLVLLAIRAGEAEVAACQQALDQWRAFEPMEPAISARAHLVWTLLNHNDFVTQR